jgi:hypothetical protein
MTAKTYPSFYGPSKSTDKPPVWGFMPGGGIGRLLYPGNGVGSSLTLGSVEWTKDGYRAIIGISGTREIPGSFGLGLGVYATETAAMNAVDVAVAARHLDPDAFDAEARRVDRLPTNRRAGEGPRRADKYRLLEEFVDHDSEQDWNGYAPEFRSYAILLSPICPNFSDNDVARALDRGLSVEEAAAELNADGAEAAAAHREDFEGTLGRDMSMNG